MRPDYERIKRNVSVIQIGAGETATIRAWASAAAGSPQYGVPGQDFYTTRVVTALFSTRQPIERVEAGGRIQPAGMTQSEVPTVTLGDPLGNRDEIVWNGTAYRVEGAAIPVHLGGRPAWIHQLKQANQ